ncbi:MAG: hypothetical protein HQL79_08450 [Magnetococcales bacterium]|nr:hypothetical protein [Magnetococcales bacterium]
MKINITMPAFVEKLRVGFDEKNPKQRYLILAVALMVSLQGWLTLLWDPHQKSMKISVVAAKEMREEIDNLRKDVQLITSKKIEDPNALREKRIQDLLQERQKLVDKLGQETGALIQPAEMVKALRQLLAARQNIVLLRLNAAHIEPIHLDSGEKDATKSGTDNAVAHAKDSTKKPDNQDKANNATGISATSDGSKGRTHADKASHPDAPVIFRHDIELEIRASYLDTLGFFKEIEAYPWVFYWDTLHFQGQGYPNTQTTLKLFTLSIGEGLIGG